MVILLIWQSDIAFITIQTNKFLKAGTSCWLEIYKLIAFIQWSYNTSILMLAHYTKSRSYFTHTYKAFREHANLRRGKSPGLY